MASTAHLARAMHEVIEPINSIAYFAPAMAEAWQRIGLEPLGQGYFGGRAAPLGPVGPSVVTAIFYNFSPTVVGVGIPSAWELATPAQVLAARAEGMQATLELLLDASGVPTDGVTEATELARRAMDGLATAGRPMAAGNADVPPSGLPLGDLWQALTTLREYRGDGHVALLLTEGLSPVEALVLYSGWQDRVSRRFLQATRLWDDEAWQVAVERLRSRGLADAQGSLTAEGTAFRQHLEDRTDEVAAVPWAQLGPDRTRRLWDLLHPIAVAVAAGYPKPGPLALTFPA